MPQKDAPGWSPLWFLLLLIPFLGGGGALWHGGPGELTGLGFEDDEEDKPAAA